MGSKKPQTIQETINFSRREFFTKSMFGTAVALSLAPGLMKSAFAAEDPACKDKPVFVVPGKDMAMALKYSETPSKVDKALQVARQGVPFEKQRCKTCAVYTPDSTSTNAYGNCKVFMGKCVTVKEGSWCMTWSKGKNV